MSTKPISGNRYWALLLAGGLCVTTMAGCPVPDAPLGSSVDVDLPASGVLPNRVELQDDRGVRFVLAEGTIFQTLSGERLTGPVTVGLDDGGGAFPTSAPEDSVARVYTLAHGESGSTEPSHVTFQPPGALIVPAPEVSSGFLTGSVNSYIDDGQVVLGPEPGTTGTLPPTATQIPKGGLSLAGGVLPLGVPFVPFDEDALLASLPDGYGLYGDPSTGEVTITTPESDAALWRFRGAGQGDEVVGDQIYLFPIGGAPTDEFPTVCDFDISTHDTFFTVAMGIGRPGLTIGDSVAAGYSGGGGAFRDGYEVSVAAQDGTRYLKVRTQYKNKFSVRVRLCSEDNWTTPGGSSTTMGGALEGGSPDEEDLDGPYDAPFELLVIGCSEPGDEFDRHVQLENEVRAAADELAGETEFIPVVFRFFEAREPGVFWSAFIIHGFNGSIRTFAEQLSPDYTYEYHNRRLGVYLCPDDAPLVIEAIAGGEEHSLALSTDGRVFAWGLNGNGQLSVGDGVNGPGMSIEPVHVADISGGTAIGAGGSLSMVLVSDGTVRVWGFGGTGSRGDGSTSSNGSFNPEVVQPDVSDAVAIASSGGHNLVLKSDGTVWGWGGNTSWELGEADGTRASVLTPIQVQGLSGVTALEAGGGGTAALLSDGTVRVLGNNYNGIYGNGTTGDSSSTPIQPNISDVVALAVGSSHMLALKSDGTVWSWGDNEFGQLGDGTTGEDSSTPVQVSGLANVVAISAGMQHSVALLSDGTVWSWGTGRLGNGSHAGSPTAVQASGLTDVTAIAAGGLHTMALRSDGTLWTWGLNEFGQLGVETPGDEYATVPVQVGF